MLVLENHPHGYQCVYRFNYCDATTCLGMKLISGSENRCSAPEIIFDQVVSQCNLCRCDPSVFSLYILQ